MEAPPSPRPQGSDFCAQDPCPAALEDPSFRAWGLAFAFCLIGRPRVRGKVRLSPEEGRAPSKLRRPVRVRSPSRGRRVPAAALMAPGFLPNSFSLRFVPTKAHRYTQVTGLKRHQGTELYVSAYSSLVQTEPCCILSPSIFADRSRGPECV